MRRKHPGRVLSGRCLSLIMLVVTASLNVGQPRAAEFCKQGRLLKLFIKITRQRREFSADEDERQRKMLGKKKLGVGCGYGLHATWISVQPQRRPGILHQSIRGSPTVSGHSSTGDKQCSKAGGVEEVNGDESDTPRLHLCS